MKRIEVWAQLNPDKIDQSTYEFSKMEITIPENATKDQIEKIAKETATKELIDWGWEEVKEGEK